MLLIKKKKEKIRNEIGQDIRFAKFVIISNRNCCNDYMTFSSVKLKLVS